jgi:peptidoglycan/LPS O-acetylase OafA/YrhL
MKLQYRPELDGLRALAVIVVVLYHAEIILFGEPLFKGGYLGVDIFFVLSGYLITRIILREFRETNGFRIRSFFERRARRILPALYSTVLLCLVVGLVIMRPSNLVELSWSAIATILFGSNLFFLAISTEYGAQSAMLKPLLHTWSLGIEEQFYIFYALMMFIVLRYARSYLLGILTILCLVSVIAMWFFDPAEPEKIFFSPLTRVWELLVGAIAAYFERSYRGNKSPRVSSVGAMIGLLLVLGSVYFFDENTPHPSWRTLIPALGVVAIILFTRSPSLTRRLLRLRLLVKIGLISYSVYLLHFPAFSFLRIIEPSTGNLGKITTIFFVILCSVGFYQFIEQPFRNRSVVTFRSLIGAGTMAFGIIVIISAFSISEKGLAWRYSPVSGLENFEIDNVKLQEMAKRSLRVRIDQRDTFLEDKIKVLIVGNSHAKDMFLALTLNQDLFPQFDFLVAHQPGHLWTQLRCFQERDGLEAPEYYQSQNYQKADVLLISTRFGSGRLCNQEDESNFDADFEGLGDLISRALADNKSVVILSHKTEFDDLYGVPIADYRYERKVRRVGLESVLGTMAASEFVAVVNEEYFDRMSRNEKIYEADQNLIILANLHSVPYFDQKEIMCDVPYKRCFGITPDGSKSFWDYGHFTVDGAKFFGRRFFDRGFAKVLQSKKMPK